MKTKNISKRILRLGGMAPSQRTRSIWVVRDIPVVACSAPGIDTTRHVAYRPPIAVSPFVLALSVSWFEPTLTHSGQLWPYVGIVSSGTWLRRDFNGMGDAVKTSPHVPSTSTQNAFLSLLIIHIIRSRQIDVGIDIPALVLSVSCPSTSSYVWNYRPATVNVSLTENLHSNCRRCLSLLYKFGDKIQVTCVVR